MMKRLLLAFLLLFMAAPVLATSVPGTWDVGQQPISYPVIGPDHCCYAEQLGDGSNAHGGLPPFFALQPADIPVTSEADQAGTGAFESVGDPETKVRFTLYGNKVAGDDTLRAHCQRGASHGHEFLGGIPSGACSDYTQIRTDCVALRDAGKKASTNPGDAINCSVYWHPWLEDCGTSTAPLGGGTVAGALGDGKCRIKHSLLDPIYYVLSNGKCGSDITCLTNIQSPSFIDFPMGLGYVNVRNMDDPWNLAGKNRVLQANAANTAAGGGNYYELSDSGIVDGNEINGGGDGFFGWSCGGAEKGSIDDLDCAAGATLIMHSEGASCADGHNLYSQSGYDHVIAAIKVNARETPTGPILTRNDVCPIGWYKIPTLSNKPQWILHTALSSTVANDSPFLSSDAAFQAKARADAGRCIGLACAPADAATFVCKPGCSFHFDYFVAWQKKYLRRAFRKCLGIPQTDTSETGVDADETTERHACNGDTIAMTPPTQLKPAYNQHGSSVDGSTIDEYYPRPINRGGHPGGSPHTM
jgi:hypothetical protein